jgi:HAD superfamily hydrolase (TIGR01509 family)
LLDMSEVLAEHKIRCLLFDLGDTLWHRASQEDWARQESASNQRAIELLRQHIDPTLLPRIDDLSLGQRLRHDFDKQIRTAIRCSPLLEPDAIQAITRVLQTWGLDGIDIELGALLFEAMRIRVPNSRPFFPDAFPTLTELRQRGFLLGIVTNRLWGGEPFYEDLAAIGLLTFFDPQHIAISGDLHIRKPNPQIFEYVLNALQISPQETAMIGDSLSADILGAQPLGIYAIWKPKPWLYPWALEHATPRPVQVSVEQSLLLSGAFPGIDTADTQIPVHTEPEGALAEGLHITDDDYILARAQMSRGYLEQFQRGEIRPDYIIGQLSELLKIFPEATKS